ncbi:hypothetical protein L596_025306 [Steinernema carpocapsae]|uniref:Uncharacterized protein n=1 Tax=Steinernema carpocapsae TaxID=34508 RepID=A0A4U5M7E0_STECR|nr:hypothetical protein L596_025306 [Steinernema carpocapsae]
MWTDGSSAPGITRTGLRDNRMCRVMRKIVLSSTPIGERVRSIGLWTSPLVSSRFSAKDESSDPTVFR